MKISTAFQLVWMWELFSFDCNTARDEAMRQLGFIKIIKKDFLNQVKLFSELTASFLKEMGSL